jgi:CoA-transferase family III
MAVAVGNDQQFAQFCFVLGIPALAQNERFSTNKARVTNRQVLIALVQSYWLGELESAGGPDVAVDSYPCRVGRLCLRLHDQSAIAGGGTFRTQCLAAEQYPGAMDVARPDGAAANRAYPDRRGAGAAIYHADVLGQDDDDHHCGHDDSSVRESSASQRPRVGCQRVPTLGCEGLRCAFHAAVAGNHRLWPIYRLHLVVLPMSIAPLWRAIEAWPISAAVRGDVPGTEWLFPIIETLHVVALTIVVGSIAMVDLRLLGIASRNSPVSRLSDEVLPWTWTAWCMAAVFGTLMFMSKAHTYAGNLQFRLKFLCMGLAAVNMLIFHLGAYRQVARWDSGEPPMSAKMAGALSLLFWIGVVFFGRWVGFTT